MQGVNGYLESSESTDLESFVLNYQPLVKKIALHIKRKLPSSIELNDLLQSGLVGLLEAKKNYRPGMGAQFETFASIRIRGAIIDALRKNSWVTKDSIKNMKLISNAISVIEQRSQKHATTEEIADELGLSEEETLNMMQEVNYCNVISLDTLGYDKITQLSEMSVLESDECYNEQLKFRLTTILKTLPEREQMILSLYYVEELTFKQIGEILELTEARICQLHVQAIARVKTIMAKKDSSLAPRT